MPGTCSNSWQVCECGLTIGYLWRSSDLFERLVFASLALLLAYIVLVLGRFYVPYASFRRESGFLSVTPNYAGRGERKLVADLSRGLGMLRSINSVAPYLGLAGACEGVLYRLMWLSIAMPRDSAITVMAAEVAAALITTAAGIIVATSATLSHNLLTIRIESLMRELARTSLTELMGQSRRLGQKFPLQRRFSGVPPFALVSVPFLASLVAIFTFFQPYEVPTGLPVLLLPVGSLDKHRPSLTPVVVSVVSDRGTSTAVVRVNSKATPLEALEKTLVREQKGASKRRVYIEAEGILQWSDVAPVIDIAEGVGEGYVVLLTTTPAATGGREDWR